MSGDQQGPAWLIQLGPLLRKSGVWYKGERIRKIRSLKIEAGLDDVSLITLQVVNMEGITIEGADGTRAVIEVGPCYACKGERVLFRADGRYHDPKRFKRCPACEEFPCDLAVPCALLRLEPPRPCEGCHLWPAPAEEVAP